MKKIILACLIAFTLVATGSAIAWEIDIDIDVDDAFVDVTASTPLVPTDDGAYWMGIAAGVHGDGQIDAFGNDGPWMPPADGWMWTQVSGEGELYANQALIVTGCCPECEEGPCCEAPNYAYAAGSYATIDGSGYIYMDQGAVDDWYYYPDDNLNAQYLYTQGEGDFTAGMMSVLAVEGQDPVAHAMGASGTNVGFWATGTIGMDGDNCAEGGYFIAEMWFCDEGCPCEPCPDCNDCPPGCPCD